MGRKRRHHNDNGDPDGFGWWLFGAVLLVYFASMVKIGVDHWIK